MAESILNEKSVLAVDVTSRRPEVGEEIEETCRESRFDKASTYEEAVAR
jgi:hypothetical protein